jgi:hypothetical protein
MNEKLRPLSSKSKAPQEARTGGGSSPASRSRQTIPALPDRIRGILGTRNLTLYSVSRQMRELFPKNRRCRIPRNFYFRLRSSGLSPTIGQLFGLAKLSSYRLADWLDVFGFRVDEIGRLGNTLPRKRTALLDTSTYDSSMEIPWFRSRPRDTPLPEVAPLSLLLEASGPRRISSLSTMNRNGFLYAKIGCEDPLAFPELVPGSIVRVNTLSPEHLLQISNGEVTENLFLVEHARGLCCCRLHPSARNRITFVPTQLPFAQVELELGSEARILGALDLEFRPLRSKKQSGRSACSLPEVSSDLAKLWKPSPLPPPVQQPSTLLRSTRLRAGLSLREASEMSREIANALGDRRYFTSPGSLSDYEATNTPPRHIHKLFTLCILYSIRFRELLSSFGYTLTESRFDAIPSVWMRRERKNYVPPPRPAAPKVQETPFLEALVHRIFGIPFFLDSAIPSLSGLSQISLRDVFWVGGQTQPLHPSLTGALFVIVNRQQKKPVAFRRKSTWDQPLYLLRKRDGAYLLASCSLEDRVIAVHPYSEGFVRPERFRNGVDAEVVGQIVTVIRSLAPRRQPVRRDPAAGIRLPGED